MVYLKSTRLANRNISHTENAIWEQIASLLTFTFASENDDKISKKN